MSNNNVHIYFAINSHNEWNFTAFSKLYKGEDCADLWKTTLERCSEFQGVSLELQQSVRALLAKATKVAPPARLKRIASSEGSSTRATTRSCTRTPKNWFENGTIEWINRPPIFNSLSVITRAENPEEWPKFNTWVAPFNTSNKEVKDVNIWLEPILRNWTFSALGNVLQTQYPIMRAKNSPEMNEIERHYVWTCYEVQLFSYPRMKLWRACAAQETEMEGWLLIFTYGPLLSIFLEIQDTILKMTEKKGVVPIPGGLEYRHDGVLHHKRFKVDLMIIEAKPGNRKVQEDYTKLSRVLALNLSLMEETCPKMKRDDLRTYGIMLAGYQCTLLEMRFHEDTAVMYFVSQVSIPKNIGSSDQLGTALKMIIAFKRRIEVTMKMMLDATVDALICYNQ
ncbi:hypothetical protein BGZ65_001635 [Modicella reniformis]|uniref:Uncharacterized protein n=1 Tax=Modicella reniformis TaxID=1440133 RepID=A0A9P6M0V8_9FUNG|nr:hypothetical protein BGZ65_001635 [Modicella reniformis]